MALEDITQEQVTKAAEKWLEDDQRLADATTKVEDLRRRERELSIATVDLISKGEDREVGSDKTSRQTDKYRKLKDESSDVKREINKTDATIRAITTGRVRMTQIVIDRPNSPEAKEAQQMRDRIMSEVEAQQGLPASKSRKEPKAKAEASIKEDTSREAPAPLDTSKALVSIGDTVSKAKTLLDQGNVGESDVEIRLAERELDSHWRDLSQQDRMKALNEIEAVKAAVFDRKNSDKEEDEATLERIRLGSKLVDEAKRLGLSPYGIDIMPSAISAGDIKALTLLKEKVEAAKESKAEKKAGDLPSGEEIARLFPAQLSFTLDVPERSNSERLPGQSQRLIEAAFRLAQTHDRLGVSGSVASTTQTLNSLWDRMTPSEQAELIDRLDKDTLPGWKSTERKLRARDAGEEAQAEPSNKLTVNGISLGVGSGRGFSSGKQGKEEARRFAEDVRMAGGRTVSERMPNGDIFVQITEVPRPKPVIRKMPKGKKAQTVRGLLMDQRRQAATVAAEDPKTEAEKALVERWKNNPSRMDRKGFDTPGSTRIPTQKDIDKGI